MYFFTWIMKDALTAYLLYIKVLLVAQISWDHIIFNYMMLNIKYYFMFV